MKFLNALLVLSLTGTALVASAEEIKMDWQPSGIAKTASYRYERVYLTPEKPAGIKVVPPGLSAPVYGTIRLGPVEAPATFFLIVDEPDGQPSRLFVDANANGDFTDDAPAEWVSRTATEPKVVRTDVLHTNYVKYTNYSGGVNLELAYGPEKLALHLMLMRYDKKASSATAPTNLLFYYRDYARAGEIPLGSQTYHALLLDQFATGDFRPVKGATNAGVVLLLDLNHNGTFERTGETFDVTKPFNIGGTTYEIAGMTPSGGSFQIVKSSQVVEETLPRPILTMGHPAIAFEAKTTGGDTIRFPVSYKGKLVLLDFWATWCAPCRRELPNVSAAYQKFHDKGFEVLGVSLDKADAGESLAKFTSGNHMPWPEIYDGQFWKAAVAKAYYVDSIPHPFLVDGDTGMILAEGNAARDEALSAAIEKALAEHR